MNELIGKTDAGRREIRERTHNLSRPARNLLLILDASRRGDAWVAMVHGATMADLQLLLDAGLVAVTGSEGNAAPEPLPAPVLLESQWAAARGAPPLTAEPEPAVHTSSLPYEALYSSLNALVKDQLGLIKGYKYSLQVERASGVAELVEVAVRVVDEVRAVKGDGVADMVSRALGLGA